MDKKKLSEYHHEALDRSCMVLGHLEMALDEHPYVERYKDIQAAYEEAQEKLAELYQLIGSKSD